MASAADGILEINHASAIAGGGFPVTIAVPGSYRLTSNLDLSLAPRHERNLDHGRGRLRRLERIHDSRRGAVQRRRAAGRLRLRGDERRTRHDRRERNRARIRGAWTFARKRGARRVGAGPLRGCCRDSRRNRVQARGISHRRFGGRCGVGKQRAARRQRDRGERGLRPHPRSGIGAPRKRARRKQRRQPERAVQRVRGRVRAGRQPLRFGSHVCRRWCLRKRCRGGRRDLR